MLTESVDAGWRLQLWGAAGELQMGWDGRGTRTRHTYDALLRPLALFEQCLDAQECCMGQTLYGTQTTDSTAHNQCGQPIRVDDTAGSRQVHAYSLQGAPLAETRRFLQQLATPDWPQAIEHRDALLEPTGATTHWQYNSLGAVLRQTDALGNSQATDYNIAGQAIGTRLQLNGQPERSVISNIVYNAFGQITTETAGNGVTTQATYRPDTGVLLRLVAQRPDKTRLQDLRYDYDPVGNVVSIADETHSVRHFANARIEPINTYQYDTLSQLINATGREAGSSGYGPQLRVSVDPNQLVNYTQTYDYDAAGNLHTLQHRGAQRYTRHLQTAERSNRSLMQQADGQLPDAHDVDAGFDANGNLQQLQPGQTLHWDGRNQLCRVTPVTRDDGVDDSEHYLYDGGGQRLCKVRISQAKTVRHIAHERYLPGLQIREDSASGETLHVITVQSPGRNTVRVLHWATNTPEGVDNDQLRYGIGDHLGSSTLELDSDAHLVSQEGYYPYGGTAWWAASNQTEVKYKTVRYSGKERDATGLYYYGFRYYAPGWGRWLNPDPAGGVDGLNVFRMVRNNPVSYKDDDGHVANWFIHEYQENTGDYATRRLTADELHTLFSNGKPKVIISGDGHNNPPLDYAGNIPDLNSAAKRGNLKMYVEEVNSEVQRKPETFQSKIHNNIENRSITLEGWEPSLQVPYAMIADLSCNTNDPKSRVQLMDLANFVSDRLRTAAHSDDFASLGPHINTELAVRFEHLSTSIVDNMKRFTTAESITAKNINELVMSDINAWRDQYINPYLGNKIINEANKNPDKTLVFSVGFAHLLDENVPIQNFLSPQNQKRSFKHDIIFNNTKNPAYQPN
ncbi:RHS repeat-associated core domain-containing protein [Pseudomonas marginalis]|uniref:RHS repeat-associated core domain-containing protein n=1 Tax=Pseudomonas marginalis TaxID=298 RepID=UPI003B9FE3A5